MKRGCPHMFAIFCLSFALSVMTLLFCIQPSAEASCEFRPGEEVVYKPNDDLLLTMSYSQARKTIESMERRNLLAPSGYTCYNYNCTIIKDIKILFDRVTWTENNTSGVVVWFHTSYLKSMDPFVGKSSYGTYDVLLGRGDASWHETARHRYDYVGNANFWCAPYRDEAVPLADAFYVLKRYAEGYTPEDPSAQAAFLNRARTYREMPVKPPLPEAVQECRIMAEDAFKNKDFKKALDYYRKGLAIEPLWPQGLFNSAMLEAELQTYGWAALGMKHSESSFLMQPTPKPHGKRYISGRKRLRSNWRK